MEKNSFYIIGEYGTKSLRPHWHCLLFFNSSSLSQAFEDCINVGTTSRPCSCPRFLRPLWEFGICDSKRTNGEAYNYVSSYVNQSFNFPKLLVLLSNQKAYHSIQLGQILPEESFVSAIKKVTFRFLSDNSTSIRLGLQTLIPSGGRITLGSSQSLPVQVSLLLSKHIEYLRASKH